MTEAPRLFDGGAGATVDLNRRGGRKDTLAPTRAGGRTVVDGAAVPTMRPGATRVVTAPPVPRAPARPAPAPRPSVLPWVAMVLALVAVGVAGTIAWKSQQAPATPPVTQAAATPAPPPTTVATPTPPPVTAAPAPTFEEAGGKAAAQIRNAQGAFQAGNYDRAVAAAQEALREDPANANALKVLENAQSGQKALVQLRAAEAALARGDFAAAESELDGARRLAPWDRGVADFSPRIAEARARAQREAETKVQSTRTTQVNAALNQAATALQNRQYEAAIAAYDQALALELDERRRHQRAGRRRSARRRSPRPRRAAPGPAAAKTFVPGRTEAKGTEQGGNVRLASRTPPG